MSKDQAAKIVASVCLDPNTEPVGAEVKLQRLIRRAIASAVRKERERCGEAARQIKLKSFHTRRASVFVCDDILDAIYRPEPQARRKAPAKNRKGKR